MSSMLTSMPSFSSLYDLVASPLRPSSPVNGYFAADSTTSTEDRLVRQPSHSTSHDSHSTPRQPQNLHMQPYSNFPSFSPPLLPPVQEPSLQLTADCPSCGATVVMRAPSWLSTMHETRREYEEAIWEAQMAREACVEHGGPSRRDRVVNVAVGTAKAFRESKLPGLLLLLAKAFIALCIYLDEQFQLKQKGVKLFWALVADLQYVEKETGLMKQSGEALGDGLSVLWEAAVKGAIALANPNMPLRPDQFERRGHSYPSQPHNTPHYSPYSHEHDPRRYPFPASTTSSAPFNYPPPSPHSYPTSPTEFQRPTTTSTSSTSSTSYLREPFAYRSQASRDESADDEDEGDDEGTSDYLATGSSSSSVKTTMPSGGYSSSARKTLRHASSVPAFYGGYDAADYAARPRMPRQRSRSGPTQDSDLAGGVASERLQVPLGGQGRGGWMAQTVKSVVGRVL